MPSTVIGAVTESDDHELNKRDWRGLGKAIGINQIHIRRIIHQTLDLKILSALLDTTDQTIIDVGLKSKSKFKLDQPSGDAKLRVVACPVQLRWFCVKLNSATLTLAQGQLQAS